MSNREHLERVSAKVAGFVVAFFKTAGIGAEFHVDQLRRYVLQHYPTAPDSAGRIMRDLRQRGYLDYEVLNRRDSLYRIKRTRPKDKAA